MARLSISCRRSRVHPPTEHPYPRRTWSAQCRSRPNDHKSSRSLTILPCDPSSPLDTHRSVPTKPNPTILPRARPDPTIPMDSRPSFSRCLAGATRTPPKPPDSPQSRPRPLVSSNGNPTSHAELGPPVDLAVSRISLRPCGRKNRKCKRAAIRSRQRPGSVPAVQRAPEIQKT